MAAHGMSYGRRKGNRASVERQMDQNWRQPPRSGSPGAPLVNGSSPYSSFKRDPPTNPADYEYKKNVEFLKREWKKFETEYRTKKDTITEYVPRDANTQGQGQDFQPVDLDAFLENLHQLQQQQQ